MPAENLTSGAKRKLPPWTVISLVVAVVTTVALLASPWSRSADPRPVATPPPGIAQVWPQAKIVTIAGVLPDGSAYQPLQFIDERSSVGLATLQTAAGPTSSLVAVGDGRVQVLREYGEIPARVSAVTDGSTVYWLEGEVGLDGVARTSLWRAQTTEGAPVKLSGDTGDAVVGESPYDLALAGGSLHWVANSADGEPAELRSLSIAGGRVAVRPIPAGYTLRDWPWAARPAQGRMGPQALLNLETGQSATAEAAAEQVLDCDSRWCRISTLHNGGSNVEHAVMRADGSGYRLLSRDDGRYPVGPWPLLMDRFAVQGQAAPQEWQPDRLWLLDIVGNRTALASMNYTLQFGAQGYYIWWSSGDNEALQWNLLDLRQLTG